MILDKTASVFDAIHEWWEKPQVSRRLSLLLMLAFLGAGIGIVLNKLGLLPPPLDTLVPKNPFRAIQLAFSLILALEVMELIFAISDSLSRAVGKQMEIMALILLRESFTDISLLNTPFNLGEDWYILMSVACTALGGMLLFVFRSLFTRLYVGMLFNDNVLNYVNVKKAVSLFLLLTFIGAGIYDVYGILGLQKRPVFFEIFYTSLIFTDIFMVLVSQYFMPCFHATFRNSGYAVGTLIMRIALSSSEHYVGALLCVFAGVYLLALTWATSHFMPEDKRKTKVKKTIPT